MEHNLDANNTTFTFIGMVEHTYYHPGKVSSLTSTGMVGLTYYHPRRDHVYHFPLEGTLI